MIGLHRLVPIVFLDFGRQFRRIGSQISLKHDALLAHNEGHDAGVTIFHSRRDDGKPAPHFAINDVLFCPAGCLVSSLRKDTERISVNHRRFIWRQERVFDKILHSAERA